MEIHYETIQWFQENFLERSGQFHMIELNDDLHLLHEFDFLDVLENDRFISLNAWKSSYVE